MEFQHISVLLNEAVDALNVKPAGVYVDCTAGGGGHSAEILRRLGPDGRLVLLDQDPDAIATLRERFGADARVTIVQTNFSAIRTALNQQGIDRADGILAIPASSEGIDAGTEVPVRLLL